MIRRQVQGAPTPPRGQDQMVTSMLAETTAVKEDGHDFVCRGPKATPEHPHSYLRQSFNFLALLALIIQAVVWDSSTLLLLPVWARSVPPRPDAIVSEPPLQSTTWMDRLPAWLQNLLEAKKVGGLQSARRMTDSKQFSWCGPVQVPIAIPMCFWGSRELLTVAHVTVFIASATYPLCSVQKTFNADGLHGPQHGPLESFSTLNSDATAHMEKRGRIWDPARPMGQVR